MNKTVKSVAMATVLGFSLVALQGCSPEVGSKEWCAELKEKPKGDWSGNEVKDFARHCIL